MYTSMSILVYVVIFSLLGGVVSLIGAALLLSKQSLAEKLAQYAMPFAAGALLAAVFLDLLREGVEQASASTVLYAALAGVLLFFFAERFLRWFHHHHQHESKDPTVPLIIAGDTLHNALDGVAIAAAFLVSIPTGIVTTIAVAAHEIPQEIGEFGLLLKKGMKRSRVLAVNVLSSLAAVAAAVITYWVGDMNALPVGLLLGLSAGFLLYIALSDIIPLLHEDVRSTRKIFDAQPFLLILGVIVVAVSISLAHNYIGGHNHDADYLHDQSSHTHEAGGDHEHHE